MRYKIQVDYIACGSRIPYSLKNFSYKGNPREALNYRINKLLETNERDINKGSLERARLYLPREDKPDIKLLEVDYREGSLEVNLKATKMLEKNKFWLKGF
jgi:hypothetical protein